MWGGARTEEGRYVELRRRWARRPVRAAQASRHIFRLDAILLVVRWIAAAILTTSACGRIAFDLDTSDDGGDADVASDGPTSETGASSCRDLHAAEPSFLDGVYTVDTNGAGAGGVHSVYCDMTTTDGGWTLVGRSVANVPTGTFGWNGATGRVDDDSAPYSLGAVAEELAFTELLIGSHGGTKAIADRAYRVPGSPSFIAIYAQASLRSESSTAIGSCTPSPFVTMLLFKGQTDLAGVFWFRDSEFVGDTPHGLFPGGWDTYYPGRARQAELVPSPMTLSPSSRWKQRTVEI